MLGAVPVYYVMLASAAAIYALLLCLERSPLGTALRAVRDNEERTSYFGFDVSVYKTVSFAVSAGAAGFAGALFATQFGFVSPALIGVSLSTEALVWTALGGRDVLLAAFLGLPSVLENAVTLVRERAGRHGSSRSWSSRAGCSAARSRYRYPDGWSDDHLEPWYRSNTGVCAVRSWPRRPVGVLISC